MKKQLLTSVLFVFLTAFAWAQIDLTSPTIPVLGTTDTVTPTLSWTESLTPDPTNYTITISKSPTMANPVYTGQGVTNSHAIPTEHFLDYETTYYWQVQANNSSGLYGTPSTIGTFTTPKMSVVPHLRWAEITGESGDYTVEISDNSTFTTPITSTTTSDLYYKVATPLKYNTFYFWRVKRGASTSTTNSFTTKPLNLISESYKVSGSPITPYTSIAFGAVITYTAITDEFEDLSTQNANVNFTYSSTFVNSTPVVNQLLEYGTPDANYHSAISTNITAKQWDGTLSAFPIIDITDNETLSLKFQYGSEMKLTTPTSTYVPIQSIATYTDGGYSTTSTAYHFDDTIYLLFTTAGLSTDNNSIKVIIKNKNDNSQLIRYAIKSGNNYQLALTEEEINTITRVGLADRISIYPANQTDMTRDFIWLGNTPGTVAAAATASPTNIQFNGSFTVSVLNAGLVRVVSTIDPVGFVLSLPLNGTASITSGSATDVQGKIIEAAIATNSISIVKPDGAAYTTPQNVTVDSYQLIAFNMIAPSNFTQDADIYPKFEWSAAKGGRGIEDNFFYRVTIATTTNFASATIVETAITQNTFYYPQKDLKFGTTYYWKVVAVQGGTETPPANIGTMQAWNFVTISSGDNYYISSIIPANRTLTLSNSPYIFINSPGTAANTTLTIEAGVELKFAVNTSLALGGDIIANGTSSDLITFTTEAESWKGIEFNTAAGITRSPLLVNEDGSYLSGSLLEYVIIEKALTPIQSVGAGKVDIYFDHVTFTGNETGIDLGIDSKSYFKDVTFESFVANTTTNKTVIKGGHSFDTVKIDGAIGGGRFLGSAIQTSDKNVIVKNSSIKNLTGNGIEITAIALDGSAYIYNNTIQNIGTANTNFAIKAAVGASVVGNTIGGTTLGVQNFATSILRGKYIANNTIVQNRGLGAIEADANDAVVINNTITDNEGYAIKNGINISNNTIKNSDTTIANNVIKDAITASPTATVSNNTLTNITGSVINGGKIITNNSIKNLETITATGTVDLNYAIKATANQNAVIQNNTILYPMGFAIQNGKTIKNNTITGGTNNLATNNYAIRAEAGAEVSNNVIEDIRGIGIENGILIHNNTVTNVINYIKADGNAVITHNTLKGGLLAYESTANYAILNGSIINSNTIKGITSAGTTNLISSAFMTEFNNNIVGGDDPDDINKAQNILEATKTGATSLTIDGNIFENNQYRNDAIKVTSANISIKNNQILNDYEMRAGGFIPGLVISGTGVALYIKANDANALIQGNTITGHLGSKDGAALYLESVASSKVIVKSNIISNNHITHVEGRGAAIFHNGLGILEIDNNTITFNYIPEEGNDSSIGSAIYSAGTTPPVSGSLKINNNIIASNGGKWAIYGRPSQMNYNNLYDNTIDGKEEVWTGADQNHGMNLKLSPATANYTINATNNFWGTRSDLGNIDPSIFDDNEQASLPAVVYQPLLTGPSLTTPGTVSNISAVSVTGTGELADLTGIINLPISTTIWATIQAKDNNQYSNDYTEVIVQNTNSGQYLSLLLKEKGKNTSFNTEVYKDSFSLSGTASDYDPVNKVLPVTSGDQIVIVSSSDPSKRVTLNANLTGNALINPYVNVFDFGTWADASAITKTFTLTNSGADPLVFASSNAVQITGTDAAQFALTAASYNSTSIAPGASVDIVVTYTADSTPATHTANLVIDFTDNPSDRTIALSGTSITAWTGLANNDQFGEPVIKTNQMTLNISHVNINGNPAAGGDRIAAYVVTGLEEELRGNAVIQTGGSASLVIQTDIANETIIFKVWDATNYILYDSPNTIISAPGTIVNSRAPIVIDGLSKLTLSGTVDDGTIPLPEAILVNRHADADINPNTNKAHEYSIFADGTYEFMVWQDTPMILNAELADYTFAAIRGTGSPSGNNLAASTTDITVGSMTYPSGTVYVNVTPLIVTHTLLNFTGTIIPPVMYVVTGNLSYEGMPLAGVTFTVDGHDVTTDENGNFFFEIESGEDASIAITQANLNAAGYTEIVLATSPTTITTTAITADTYLGNILDASLLNPTTTGNKTQTIALKTGWNLISINVVPADPTPSVVFNGITQIEEVRTESSVWESVGSTGTLTEIKPNQGYYVKVSADATLSVSGKAAPIAEIGLRNKNWNLVGYTMQNMGQTRTMIQNDDDIQNISDLRETYYQADYPLGSSTLRFMKPGSGYWMRTGETVSPAFTYNVNYSNVIKSMEFRTVTNQSWVKGKIDNDFVGFPMGIVTIASDDATVIGETYKDLTTGEIFVATTATNGTGHNIRNIKGPKSIDVSFSHDQDLTSLAATIVEGTPFIPAVTKVFTATDYATLIGGLYDAQGNVINWGGFLTNLAAGNDLGATIDLSTTPIYIVYATDLSTEAAQQQAQVAVYCVTSNTSANTANELLAFGIQNSAGTTTVWGTVNETTHIAKVILPHDFNTTGAKIVFSIDGAGFYTDNTGTIQLVSGTTAYVHGTGNITALTYYVSSSEGSPAYQDYNIQVVKLPVPVSPAPAPKRTPLLAKSSVEEVAEIREAQDPFGQVNYLPNSHYVLGRITNNGSAVHPDYIVAAYIGEELRGKQQVVYYNNMSYIPILVSTIQAGEPITFKIWKDGSVVKTFDNTLLTIPGGRTGNHGAYYQFNMASLDANDTVEPVFVNELGKAYPNPFNPTTTIEFSLKEKQNVSLSIYNIKGQIVKTLVKDQLEKGRHKVVWDGKNYNGQVVGSGIYFYRMDTKDYTKIRKAILLK